MTEITTASSATVVLKLDSAGRALLSVAQARTALSGISTSSLYKLVRPRKKFCSNRCKMKDFRRGQNERFEHLESAIERLTDYQPKMIHNLFA